MTARLTTRLLLALLLASVTTVVGVAQAPVAQALDGDDFRAGMIITDSLFFDGTAMTASEIDSFIAAKNPGCAAGAVCLENYREDVEARAATTRCKAISASTDRSAGQIIATVSKACGISPKAILVILQKEQSLVTAIAPSSRAFAYAMGAGCPDDGGCNTPNQGLYKQVYYGASLLKGYTIPGSTHYSRYAAGATSAIQYDVPISCGTKSVHVENQATHALYVYTPYTPNQAALDNLYGTGDSCSAYGNRNFWRLYNDWFGSTTAGQSLVKVSGSSTVSLLTPAGRWALNGRLKASELTADLGKVATVSQQYLDTYPLQGTAGRYVKDASANKVWALYDGQRHAVGGCASKLVVGLGVDCDAIPALATDILEQLALGDALSPVMTTPSGAYYLVDRDGRHALSSPAAATDAGIVLEGEPSAVRWVMLQDSSPAIAMLGDGDAVTVSGPVLYRLGDSVGKVGTSLWDEAHLSTYVSTPVTIAANDWVEPASTWLSGFVRDTDTGTVYMFRAWGLTAVGDAAPTDTINDIPGELLPATMPVVESGAMPPFATNAATGATFRIDASGARSMPGNVTTTQVANTLGIAVDNPKVPAVVLQHLTKGPAMFDFGSVVAKGTTTWFIDGAGVRWRIYSRHANEVSGLSVGNASRWRLQAYEQAPGYATMAVSCLKSTWLVAGGERYALTDEEAAHIAAAFPVTDLEWATCRAIPEAPQEGGRLLVAPNGQHHLVTDGVASKVKASAADTYGAPVPVLAATVKLFQG
ncbi:hypothetical protein [Demequina gelatinilytica]|uniref:hypothetical protein n=1 Tax=Demequina gelatinilytica TaxID=1638980 RepID=UPI0007818B3B|nr:hypothetical protein [Demequina gelatinilytica]